MEVLILGTDINSYYMARCYHELFHKKVTLIGQTPMAFTDYSNICDVHCYKNLYDSDLTFRKILIDYASSKSEKILLIATNDHYVTMLINNRRYLSKYYDFNYPTKSIVQSFLLKEIFYDKYKNKGLDFPQTLIYDCNSRKNEKCNFKYPVIIKPSDGVAYHELDFNDQRKVYKVNDEFEYKDSIRKIKESGYKGKLIVQEFIPGDDTYLYECVLYLSTKGKAQVASFAKVALQEHTKTAIGNSTVIVNGYNNLPGSEEVVKSLKTFLEKIKYTGFAIADIKYDQRDQKYKVLEINPRHGRGSYYLTPLGHNLVKYFLDDIYYHQEKKFVWLKNKYVLSFVPKIIIKKYVNDVEFKKEIFKLIKEKKVSNPLQYSGDKNLKRKFYLLLRKINYLKKYKNNHF